MKLKIFTMAKYVSSACLLILLLYWIDFSKVATALSGANYYLLGLALLIVNVNRVLMAGKWNMLLRLKNINISLFEVTKIYYISNFLGFFLPPTIGADLVRGFTIAKQKHPLNDIISSILIERFVGMIVIIFAGIIGGVAFLKYFVIDDFNVKRIIWSIVGIGLVASLIMFLSFNQYISRSLLKMLMQQSGKSRLSNMLAKLGLIYKSYLQFAKHKRVLAAFYLLTCLELTTYIIRSWIVARAVHVNVPFGYFFAFMPIIIVLVRLPISLHGFGIYEIGFVYFLYLIGIPESLGFSIGIVNHLMVILGLLPGVWFYARTGKSGKFDTQRIKKGTSAANCQRAKQFSLNG